MKERDQYIKLVEWSEEDQSILAQFLDGLANVAMERKKKKSITNFAK